MVEGGRQQWHIQRDGEGGYIFQAVSGDPATARATVNDLLRASNLPFHAEGDAATACFRAASFLFCRKREDGREKKYTY